jgi:UDP-N-acetylglucosamine:LPS N-acetylglucosamine transferase
MFFALSQGYAKEKTALTIPLEMKESAPVKKRVLMLSSRGGGGHLSTAKAIEQLVGGDYELMVEYPIDALHFFGVPSPEEFYNVMLRNEWFRPMNFIARHVAPYLFKIYRHKLKHLVYDFIDKHKPDLVVSLIPFINYPAAEAACRRQIPYLIVTIDNDLRNWALEMEKVDHPLFRVTIGADLPLTRELLMKKNIPSKAIETIGLPLRPEFVGQHREVDIKKEFKIPSGKEVVLIIMGGAGGSAAFEYAKAVGKMKLGIHLVIVAGRNVKLKKQIKKIDLHPSNSISVLGYTNRVADLMSVADLVITKPGPGTINEAIAMEVPIFVDGTHSSLFWERANIDLVLNYGVGQRIKTQSQMKPLLKSYLKDSVLKESLKQAFVAIPRNRFHIRIKEIIFEMIAEGEGARQAIARGETVEGSTETTTLE